VDEELEKLRQERLALRLFLRIAERTLDDIASWKEGPEVTGRFDEPNSARKARKALKSIRQLRGDNDRAALEKGKAGR
jgi:hypothetical protein